MCCVAEALRSAHGFNINILPAFFLPEGARVNVLPVVLNPDFLILHPDELFSDLNNFRKKIFMQMNKMKLSI